MAELVDMACNFGVLVKTCHCRLCSAIRVFTDLIILVKKDQVDEFHKHLNSINPNIQFTLELENNNGQGLPFLDTIERFSFECREVIGFAITTLRDWLKRFAPLFHPIRSKTKTNRDPLACIFPRFASATCTYFEF